MLCNVQFNFYDILKKTSVVTENKLLGTKV